MVTYNKVVVSQPALTNADSSVQKLLSDICLAKTGISHSLVVLGG